MDVQKSGYQDKAQKGTRDLPRNPIIYNKYYYNWEGLYESIHLSRPWSIESAWIHLDRPLSIESDFSSESQNFGVMNKIFVPQGISLRE